MQRLLELDSIRGLSALAVVLYHYFYRYNELYGHPYLSTNWSYFGSYGVQLFFMVSGFVIYWSIGNVKRPFDFIVSRFSRLYPVYWSAVCLTFFAVLIFGLPEREVSFTHALLNLTMLQSYLKVPSVDGVYWTLAVELTFYFWIFLIYLTSNLKRVEIIFSLFVIFAILNSTSFLHVPNFIAKVFLFEYLPFFLAGICFFKLSNSTHNLGTVIALLISIFGVFFVLERDVFYISLFFYLFFYLAVLGKLKFLKNSFLVFLGSISYALYLVHQNIGYIILNKFYFFGFNPLVGVVVSITFSIAISYFLTSLIERPSLVFIRNYYSNSQFLQRLAVSFKIRKV